MSSLHARLGPSNHRWPHCPGSVREEAVYQDIPGEAAIDGTGSHLLLEMCLNNGVKADAYDGEIIGVGDPDNLNGWMVFPDRCERVQQCLDYIERRVNELTEQFPGCTVTVEAESQSSPGAQFGRDDWWGTCDVTIIATGANGYCEFLEVCDYKDGRGWVGADDNSQLQSYAIGKMNTVCKTATLPCRMTIVQPKTNPTVRYQDSTSNTLAGVSLKLLTAATATDDANAPLIPDDKNGKGYCKWCKHKPNCEALLNIGIERISNMESCDPVEGQSLFEMVASQFKTVTTLSDEDLANLADAKDALAAQFAKVDEEIKNRLETGGAVPGYTMAPGRGSYKWNTDEETIIKALKSRRLKKDDYYPPKLISPAQMKKLAILTDDQKKRLADQLVEYTPGKLTVKKVARTAATAPVVDFSSEAAAEKVSFF